MYEILMKQIIVKKNLDIEWISGSIFSYSRVILYIMCKKASVSDSEFIFWKLINEL
jgi:hypothetical protein